MMSGLKAIVKEIGPQSQTRTGFGSLEITAVQWQAGGGRAIESDGGRTSAWRAGVTKFPI
jgi:hypothetical protein